MSPNARALSLAAADAFAGRNSPCFRTCTRCLVMIRKWRGETWQDIRKSQQVSFACGLGLFCLFLGLFCLCTRSLLRHWSLEGLLRPGKTFGKVTALVSLLQKVTINATLQNWQGKTFGKVSALASLLQKVTYMQHFRIGRLSRKGAVRGFRVQFRVQGLSGETSSVRRSGGEILESQGPSIFTIKGHYKCNVSDRPAPCGDPVEVLRV